MNEEYRGIYFKDKNINDQQKKFYEHGAHFEYMALYMILEQITKKIKPKINNSIPKKKNISLNKNIVSSCKRKKIPNTTKNSNKNNMNIITNIKANILNYNKLKISHNKKDLNNSLILKRTTSKNIFKKINNNLISLKKACIMKQNPINSGKRTNFIKSNSSIMNNSMEYFYNNNIKINESMNCNYNNNSNNSKSNLYHVNKKYKKYNSIALNDFSKMNDYKIFTYNKKKKGIEGKIKTKTNKNKLTDKNNYLFTKENKNRKKSIIKTINNSFDLKDEQNKKDKEKMILNNKMNIKDITLNNLKFGTNNINLKKRKNYFDSIDYSFQIKTPKYNYNVKTNKKDIYKNHCKKSFQETINANKNKTPINDCRITKKCLKNEEKPKNKGYRNNDSLNEENSFFDDQNNNYQMTFYNYKNNNLIRNDNINDDYSDIIKEKKYKKGKIGYSMERKNMKKYIKKKILEKNKLNFEIKEKVNYCKVPKSTKNYSKKKFNIDHTDNKVVKPKKIINYYYKNSIYIESNKSNNDSINKSK